jgi:hypothetical protein
MRQPESPTELHVNWDAILVLMAALLVSTGIWGAAIGALMVLLR